jgi:pilus assembly protein TadC
MPRKTKDARPGRVTPKGGPPKRRTAGAPSAPAAESGRYTAPIPREFRVSPWWVPALMIAFFAGGVLIILLNYLSLLGGSASNVYLFVGLGLIVAGFITSTRWH